MSENQVNYPDQNNTNFPQALKHNLGKLKYDEKSEFLKYHQFITDRYIAQNPKARGLLLYFNVGFGKTILAISLALKYKKIDPTRKIIVLLSKGLIQNFKDNVRKFLDSYPEFNNIEGQNLADEIDRNFTFVSFRSNLMYKKMSHLQQSQDQIDFDDQMEIVNKSLLKSDKFLENAVLIIDEAHNFFNAITNGSKNSLQLYDAVMKTRDIKLFFLTGTPIINDPFELVPCFNMLKGLTRINSKNRSTQTVTLFPESRKEFNNYFMDTENLTVKNKSRFQNRIMGLSSYYGDLYFEHKSSDFPEQLETKVIKIPMSPEQFALYDVARDLERDEASYKKKKQVVSERFTSSSSAKGTYRVRTRQISNFIFPEYAMGPKRGKKMPEKYIERIKDADWDNLAKFSPKIVEVLKNIKKHQNQLGFLYSEFVKGEGLAVVAKVLSRQGYINWDDEQSMRDMEYGADKPTKSRKVFAILTGKLDLPARTKIIEAFNAPSNKHGEELSLLLVNKIASEGLDLKGVRHIHILEPFWNYARIEQIIGRGVRYKSHSDLPASERNVQTYIYLSDYPLGYPLEKIREPTTDIDMYNKVIKNKTINGQFNLSIVESSIDCLAHYDSLTENVKNRINCKLCMPTDKPLYHPQIAKDFSMSDPCLPIQETKITVQEIVMEGTDEKFAYNIDKKSKPIKIQIYQFNPEINGYTLIKPNHPMRVLITNKILSTLDD